MNNIFIVEDDFTLLDLYKKIIELEGFTVIGTASSGDEAINKFKNYKTKPDIIIMDHRMPNKSGLEVMREIFESGNKTKIIFASADENIKEMALKLGAYDFLSKPFSSSELIGKIKNIINLKHMNNYAKIT